MRFRGQSPGAWNDGRRSALLPGDLRQHLAGFVLNKFRGDAALLAPGPSQLRELTGVPVIGVVPMRRDHGLPDEDGPYVSHAGESGPRVAILAGPHISNLDEFQPLARACRMQWVRSSTELAGADLIILPGSKQVSGDLAWLRRQRLDVEIREHARAGRRVLGVCGGLQMLGAVLDDPQGLDGEAHGPIEGLGLLPLQTRYAEPKQVVSGQARFEALAPPWNRLSGVTLDSYQIRNGTTAALDGDSMPALRGGRGAPIGWQCGPVLGVAAHGLFESDAVMRALFGAGVPTLDSTLDGLADLIELHIDRRVLELLAG